MLESTYTRTLQVLKALPESAVYRQSAEAVTQGRLDIVRPEITDKTQKDASQNEHAITAVTTKIDSGLVEELLVQAKDELNLAAKMLDWKPYVSHSLMADLSRCKCLLLPASGSSSR